MQNKPDDWSTVVHAQHKAVKQQEDQEKLYTQLNKVKYREELDQQMKLNEKLNKSTEHLKRQEFEFHKRQGIKFREFDEQTKQGNKDYCKLFLQQNCEVIQNRMKEVGERNRIEQETVVEMIRKSQSEIENEKALEKERKLKRVAEQRLEAERVFREGQAKKRFVELEKIREREMIEKKIEQMKRNENSYQEFYAQKIREREIRMQKAGMGVKAVDQKEVLIQKRLMEFEEGVKASQYDEECVQRDRKEQAIKNIKSGLDDQILSKQFALQSQKAFEKNFQDQFKKEALEEEYYKNLYRFTKNLEKEKIREDYERQIKEKRSNSLAKLKMDDREREIHSKLLENINAGQAVFPCVPGLHSSDSPAKMSYDRIYNKQRLKRDLERADSNGLNKSVESRNERYWELSSVHNPITNPIGAMIPRVLPGQRLGRGAKSVEKSNFNIKDLLKSP